MQTLAENQWVVLAKNLESRPPMPRFNLNAIKDDDLRAIYQYVRHLGPGAGVPPAYVPPDQEPNPPYK